MTMGCRPACIYRRAVLAAVIVAVSFALAAGAQEDAGKQAGGDLEIKLMLAERLIREGNAPEAVDMLEPLYQEDREREIIWQLLVTAYVKSGNPDKAAGLLERRIDRGREDYRHLRALGGVYMEMGDPESAEKVWLRILEVEPEEGKFYDEVAQLFWDSGRYDRALRLLREGTRHGAFYQVYMSRIVRWERLMNRPRDAFRDELERLLRKPLKNIRNADRLVEIYREAGKDSALISKVDSISASLGNQTCMPDLMKTALFAISGDFDRASKVIREADCEEGSQYMSFISLLSLAGAGEAGREIERFQGAVLDRFIEEYGDNRMAPRFLLEKAELMFRQAARENDQARMDQAFNTVSQIPHHRFGKPYEEKALLLMARIELEGRRRPSEAVRILSRPEGWRQRGLKKESMILKARAYALCRECGEAEKELEELAGGRDPEVSSEALYRLSEKLLYSGRYEEAAEKFAEAARQRPSGESSNDALDMAIVIKKGLRSGDNRVLDLIASASLLEAGGRAGRAADTLSLIAGKYPNSPLAPYAILWSGRLKIAGGREAEAERELAAMSEDYPNSIYAPRGMELIADMIAGERPGEALELLRTVIDRYPSDPYLDRVRRKYMQLAKQLEPQAGKREGEHL
ncbi:MAG: tetratricopeptide repeat protein [Candidatus Krumholzibacteriales bacterium]